MENKREHDVLIQAKRDSKVRVCWQRQDKKAKKLTFFIQVTSRDRDSIAGTDTIDKISQEFQNIQDRLDQISRNVYQQQEVDKEHSESK